jgi:hypothetical protein
MRQSVVEDDGEDEGTAFTAVAPTTPTTRVIIGFTRTTSTAATAVVATTTATIAVTVTVATSGDDDDNDNSTVVYCSGNPAATKSATFT